MKTQTRSLPPTPVAPSAGRGDDVRPWLLSFLLAGSIAVLIMAFFLSIYRANKLPVPLGWDTSKYLWRTALLKAVGFAHMTQAVPNGVGVDPGRPGFPVIAATLSSIFHVSTFQIAAVLPAVSAAAIGLGAGAFVAVALRRPAWEFAATALFVGMSAFVVRLTGPETYQDNLFAAAVFVTAAIPIALSLEDRRAVLPAILLLGAGGVIHWAFFLFMVGTLALTTAAYVPTSIRSWRTDHLRPVDTPAARLAAVLVGGVALAGATILGLLKLPRSPHLSASEFAKKLRQDIPKYRFGITLPIALIGAGSLAIASRRKQGNDESGAGRARFVLTLLLAWSAVTLGGYLAFKVLHLRIPAHRFLAFSLALPLLGAIGIIASGRVVARWARPAAVLLVAGALAGTAYLSHVVLFRFQTWMDPAKITDATQAEAYFETARIPIQRPLVFVVGTSDSSYAALMGHMIKASVPANRIGHVFVFVGSGDDYLARRPASGASGESKLSRRYLTNMEFTYAQDPVAVVLSSFNTDGYRQWVAAHPGTEVAPNVAVVRGPVPGAPVPVARPPIGGLGGFRVGLLGVASMAVLAAIGLGWAVLLLRRWLDPLPLLAVSPAVGIGALVAGGVVMDRLGVRLAGAGGIGVPCLVAAASWAVLGIGRLRRSSTVG